MILYPIGNNTIYTSEAPWDIPELRMWFDPNFILDSQNNGTADGLFNRAPISPKSNAFSSGTTVPTIVYDGYSSNNNSIQYNGLDTYYRFNSYSAIHLSTQNAFSFFWYEKSSLNDYYVFHTTQTGTLAGIEIYWLGGRLYFSIKNGGAGEYSVRTNVIQDSLWHSYAVVYDGSQNTFGIKIYRDGLLINTASMNNIFFSSILNRSFGNIGRKKDETNYMTGEIGHIMLYATILNLSQITTLNSYY